jgi:hypothetical protein
MWVWNLVSHFWGKNTMRMPESKVKVKVRLFFSRAPRHEGILGSGGIAPHILDFGTRWRWMVSFTHRPLYPHGKRPWYPLDRLVGPQNLSRHCGEKKNSQPQPGPESKVLRIIQVRHRNGRLLEQLKVRGVFAHGWRPPWRRRVQKVISFVVYFKIIFL